MKSNPKRIKVRERLYIAVCLPVIAITLCMPAEATEEHIKVVTTREDTYQVEMGGTLDEQKLQQIPETTSGCHFATYRKWGAVKKLQAKSSS